MKDFIQNIAILGSTGSIGQNTLAVIEQNPQKYCAFALVGGCNISLMLEQCLKFSPRFAALADPKAAHELSQRLKTHHCTTQILSGEHAICELVAHPYVHTVMAAIVGAAGLLPTLSAIQAGKRILLANKESLVTCGELFFQHVQQSGAKILPVDSEHNAIFQALSEKLQHTIGFCDLASEGVSNIILTGSGGPFRNTPLEQFEHLTPKQAIAHPNWSMGHKISVDSATMMNKGLEYIEARRLFNASEQQMEIIIHPQSIIHSMVRYIDGSVLAQMGNPDMRTPIAHTLAYPKRIPSGVEPLNFLNITEFSFLAPDFRRYPCLKLAIDAFTQGQYATTALNAANEVAVEAFLQGKIKFTDIAKLNQTVMIKVKAQSINSVQDVLYLDQQARQLAKEQIVRF